MKFFAILCCALVALARPIGADGADVTVFAAASLRGVIEDAATGYGAQVQVSYGGSGTMARQVAAGAPVDAVILASADWMAWLARNAVLQGGSERVLARNRLVLVTPVDSDLAGDLAGDDVMALLGADGRLAMGQRDAVPAGSYAREWLQNTGQWDGVMDRLAETDNVRAALALVARGETPLGVVYASDAAAEPRVRVLVQIDSQRHSPVVYPAAALTPAGDAFVTYLASPAAQATFARHGFGPVPE